jgi:hypothetical protein
MAAPPNRKLTPQQVRKAIDDLDLVEIDEKARTLYHWRRPRVQAADRWYRNFLWLCYKHGSPLAAIGRDSDDLWHLHILDTPKYTRDCEKIFGSYLSHQPLYGRITAKDRQVFEASEKLYLAEYGAIPPKPAIVSLHPPKKGSP